MKKRRQTYCRLISRIMSPPIAPIVRIQRLNKTKEKLFLIREAD